MLQLSKTLIRMYPKNCTLKDGTRVILRPLLKEDGEALFQYVQELTQADRLCFKEDVLTPGTIENWIYELDYDNIFPLIASENGRIIAEATLQFSSIGWTKHWGEIRFSVDTRYRLKGLGLGLARDLLEIATRLGLEKLSAEIPRELDNALSLLKKLGFIELTVLKGFVRNGTGKETDLVLLSKDLLSRNN